MFCHWQQMYSKSWPNFSQIWTTGDKEDWWVGRSVKHQLLKKTKPNQTPNPSGG